MRSAEERFWEKVNADGVCLEWTGAKSRDGYGNFYAGGGSSAPKYVKAHRFAWTLLVGECPEGLYPDHRCFNRLCVDPDHIEWVAHRENSRRSRGPAGRWRNSRCINGHEYTEGNTYRKPNGCRGCKTCRSERDRGRRR